MRVSVSKLEFGERPEVVLIAWAAVGALIGYSDLGGGYWGIGGAIGIALASLYNKANRILISLELLHRQLAPDVFEDD